MAQFTAYQTREALEVMLSYLLPGALAVMLYPWVAAAATQLRGFEALPQISDELSLKILLAVLIGPLLRGMDNILCPFFLNYNVLNHALWIIKGLKIELTQTTKNLPSPLFAKEGKFLPL